MSPSIRDGAMEGMPDSEALVEGAIDGDSDGGLLTDFEGNGVTISTVGAGLGVSLMLGSMLGAGAFVLKAVVVLVTFVVVVVAKICVSPTSVLSTVSRTSPSSSAMTGPSGSELLAFVFLCLYPRYLLRC